ncbi:lipopolysaccharide biosynthesis protein [Paenibacillus sp. NPDC058177]|uniref:lipopolysaccharide biosynthesis protein n=1 Tax=Paenibacillus sp. NPDC058177 TaxID=3346369 RepID=UPI0036DE5136
MKDGELSLQIQNAIKWSTLTEVLSKLITPITNMILARIIAPEAFGIIATISMIISFADLVSDAGFQKYIIQHVFKDEKEKSNNVSVAFWTNLLLAFFLWGAIILFSNPLAGLLGSPNMGNVIAIACVQLPLMAFSSIPMALYKKNLDFKSLFQMRLLSIFIPLIITIPLALNGFSYWSIILGTIAIQVSNAVVIFIKTRWKPSLFFDFKLLKEMISFSVWSLFESISIWFTLWIDTLIISSALNMYYLGLYKTSLNMVNSLMAIITATVTTVLFSALSRLQNDNKSFNDMFYKAQKILAYITLPLGVIVFLFSDIATSILLGSKWIEASNIIGIWGLTSAFSIVFSNINSEVYRSKGKPKLSFIQQIIHLAFLVPTCLISLKFGFWTFVYARALIRFQAIIVGFFIMNYSMKFSTRSILNNTTKPLGFTLIMGILAMILKRISDSVIWSVFSIIICIIFYGFLIFLFAKKDLRYFENIIKKNGF